MEGHSSVPVRTSQHSLEKSLLGPRKLQGWGSSSHHQGHAGGNRGPRKTGPLPKAASGVVAQLGLELAPDAHALPSLCMVKAARSLRAPLYPRREN